MLVEVDKRKSANRYLLLFSSFKLSLKMKVVLVFSDLSTFSSERNRFNLFTFKLSFKPEVVFMPDDLSTLSGKNNPV